MLRFLIGCAVGALSLGDVAHAAPAPLAADAAMFGARESAGQVALSPSGNRVVMLVAGPGKSTVAEVFDLQSALRTDLSSPARTPSHSIGANSRAMRNSSATMAATST